jgi:Domain of unknown function (DUF932)
MTTQQWSKVNSKVSQDDFGKADWTVPISRLGMSRDGVIGIVGLNEKSQHQLGMGNAGLTMDEHALSQFASRLGIPVRYARKCLEENPALLAQHANYWLKKLDTDTNGDKKWLLRGKNDTLRGVLTDRYSQLDNRFIFDSLKTPLDGGSAVDVKNFDLTSKLLNFRMVFPDLKSNIGTDIKRDDVMVGIHIVNSEVGASALRIESCLYRLVCENGMIARVGGSSLMNQRHVHLTQKEMENRVADAIDDAIKVGDELVDRFARSREVTVKNPLKTLERLAKSQKYSNGFTDTLKNSFSNEAGDSAFHIVNALTHASQTLPFEQRLEVETFAGNVLNDFLKGDVIEKSSLKEEPSNSFGFIEEDEELNF